MQNTLKIAIIQSHLVWEDPEENRKKFTEKINSISDNVDIIVLPEMFTTGFTMNALKVAETMQGETINWLKNISKNKETAIIGSLVIYENNNHYNRLICAQPSGKLIKYDKRHTFTLAGEHEVYTAGTEKVIFSYLGWKICPLICYDLRFPVWARNSEDYDLLLYVANWPKPRINAWDALLKARAIENMSYCIGVNRVGEDENGYEYNGHTAIYNFLGEKLSSTIEGKENILQCVVSKNKLRKIRKKLNFLQDQDAFKIEK